MNQETIALSYKSYMDAINKLSSRGFNEFSLKGSGYSHYLGENFEGYSGDLQEADDCIITTTSLFEFGRPVHIEESYLIYKGSFFTYEFIAKENFSIFYIDHPLDGTDSAIKPNNHSIKMWFNRNSIGIKYWTEERRRELVKLAGIMKPAVKSKFIEGIEKATSELNKWRSAKREQANKLL